MRMPRLLVRTPWGRRAVPRRRPFRGARRACVVAALAGALAFAFPAPGFAGDTQMFPLDTPGLSWPRGAPGEFAEWLRHSHDVVFLGRFVSWERDTSPYEAGHLVRCAVDSVLMGDAPEREIVLSRLGRLGFSSDALRPGVRVLARVARRCTITGQGCGDVMLVSPDGLLLADHIASSQTTDPDGPRLRLEDVTARALAGDDVPSRLRHVRGLAWAGLGSKAFLTTGGATYPLLQPEWLVASADSLPGFVRLSRPDFCQPAQPIDRILLPIPAGFTGDTLVVEGCPRSLQVVESYSLGLGVDVREIPARVRNNGRGGLELLPPAWRRELRGQH